MSVLRVRHPGAEPRDIDLGPCPEVQAGFQLGGAAIIGEMLPFVFGGVPKVMSDGKTKAERSFSIHPENRYQSRCGVELRGIGGVNVQGRLGTCALRKGHSYHHRSTSSVQRNNAYKRKVA